MARNTASQHHPSSTKGARTLSAEPQAEVKRRSSRSAQDRSRRRKRSRAGVTPNSNETVTVTPTSTATVEAPRTEASRAEARRLAKASAPKRKSGRGVVSNERTEGLRRFIRETLAEIRKVVWPDRETTRNLTIVVIALSIVLGILLGGLDFILFQVFEAF